VADLTKILPPQWMAQQKIIDSPEVQLIQAMRDAGLEPPDSIQMDGKLHRFRSGTKGQGGHGDKPGWYIVFGDGIPAGRFGCWRLGVEVTFRADIGRTLTHDETVANSLRLSEAIALRDAELARQRQVASDTVEKIWSGAQGASADHPYLARKGIGIHGSRVTSDGRIVVPLFDSDGTISSLQYISHDGQKLYHPGGATGGKFWQIGTMDEPGTLYMAEGFATAATIYETTHRPCVVAYSASNLVPVLAAIREMHGQTQDIVIVADNDKSGTGQKYADQASAKYGARIVMPPIDGMDANDYAQAGHNLSALLNPPKQDWLIPANSFCSQPAPISWLVKRWLQDQALIMIHGPSGGGKTFVVLDWCLRIAAGMVDWCGNKVRAGKVVYLAGEGHHGLRGRIAAWKTHHHATGFDMWLSKGGCDLNTPSGFIKAAESIRSLKDRPSIIVVDTLHRFLYGDENSAQDAKSMLDACAALMAEFGCSVVLVHHTGISEEAQHRARGSSAWRGALDIEISVIPGNNDKPIQIIQRKSKDSELAPLINVELQSVEIPGWFDEDGEPVTSAVIIESEAVIHARKESDISKDIKKFTNAWWATSAEERNGSPYLARSALLNYLIENDGVKESSAKIYIKPSQQGRLIYNLLNAGIIQAFEHGWVVSDGVTASSMMIRKGEK
jgi:phage/plasmid primase-like uncharacterized protein